ncbi:MAG: hypothetical protein ACYC5O_00855 [Anaerolineae bacterium]
MTDWGPLPAEELQLPTGRVCKVRRPSLSILAATGRIPNPILATFMGAVSQGKPAGTDLQALFAYNLHMVQAALVEPKVYLPDQVPEKGAIPIGNLTEAEIPPINTWVQREEQPARLAGFRAERAGDGAGADGDGVRAEAE